MICILNSKRKNSSSHIPVHAVPACLSSVLKCDIWNNGKVPIFYYQQPTTVNVIFSIYACVVTVVKRIYLSRIIFVFCFRIGYSNSRQLQCCYLFAQFFPPPLLLLLCESEISAKNSNWKQNNYWKTDKNKWRFSTKWQRDIYEACRYSTANTQHVLTPYIVCLYNGNKNRVSHTHFNLEGKQIAAILYNVKTKNQISIFQ